MKTINVVEKKREALAKLLDVEPNVIGDDSNTLFVFEHEYYLIIDEAERKKMLIEVLRDNHEGYSYLFQTIANGIKQSLEEVQNHYLSDVLLDNGKVDKFLDSYFVNSENVNKLIEKTVGMKQFFDNLAEHHIEKQTVVEMLGNGEEEHIVDGFFIYYH